MFKKTSNFSRSQTGDKTKKIFLYLITELKIYHFFLCCLCIERFRHWLSYPVCMILLYAGYVLDMNLAMAWIRVTKAHW